MLAGQTEDVGEVCLSIANDDIIVEYHTSADWYLDETHLWVGDNLSTMPQTKKGSPKPGRFPYTQENIDLQSYSFTWLLSDLAASCEAAFLMAAHAAVYRADGLAIVQSETAWTEGERFVSKGNWGTYSSFTFTCNNVDEEEPETSTSSETAFALNYESSLCFIDDETNNFNRWGWTNGPISEGYSGAWAMYAAAGQCDLSKGTYVGELLVSY